MKIGVMAALAHDMGLSGTLDWLTAGFKPIKAIEPGTGNYPGHFPGFSAEALADSQVKRDEFMGMISQAGFEVSALSCHGNSLHPDTEHARMHNDVHRQTIVTAKAMGIDTVITFSGAPGGGLVDQTTNWATCAWPPDYEAILEHQWQVAIKHWVETTKFAADNGVKVCFEIHPGFLVYNVATMLRMRDACGENLGCNFDPSHLLWNGVDVCMAARKLADAGAIFHVHAKDVKVDKANMAINGCNDTTPYRDERHRSWVFRTVGYGDVPWRELISELRLGGYDGVLSIEHEDARMSIDEGLGKAVSYLDDIIIREAAREMTWA